jgi:hypothetical protein
MLPETPQNGEYLVAAYVIATVILVGYWVALCRRAGRARQSVSGKSKA